MANIDIGIDLEDKAALQALTRLTKQSKKFGKAAEKNFGKASQAVNVFKGALSANLVIGGLKGITAAFTAAGRAAINLGSSFIESASEIEDIGVKFEILTGSAAAAAGVMEDLITFTSTTPFQLQGVAAAAKNLLAFGLETEKLLPTLRKLGDIAAGSGKDLTELATVFGQIRLEGKLTGERLNQLQDAGIPIGPVLEKSLKLAEGSIKKFVATGKVGFSDVEAALKTLTSEGGLFFEATIRQSKTLSGVISTLRDAFSIAGADIGKEFLPVLKSAALSIIDLINSNRELIKQFAEISGKQLAEAFLFLVQSIPKVIQSFGGLLDTIDSVKFAFRDMGIDIAQSVLNINIGIEALDQALNFLGLSSDKSLKDIQNQNDALTEFIINSKVALAEGERNRESRQKAFALATKLAKEFEIQVTKSFQAEKDAQNKSVESNSKGNKDKAENEKQALDQIALLRLGFEESQKEIQLIDDEDNKIRQTEAFELLKANLGEEVAIRTLNEAKKLEDAGKTEKAIQLIRKKSVEAQKRSLSSLFDFEKNTNAGRAANFKSTLSTISTLSQENNSTLFAIGKTAALSTAFIDGRVAVQKALASAPPPFNFALAAIVGVAVAANIVKIASSKPPAKRQAGGLVPGPVSDVDNTVIQAAGGELVLNRRQQTQLFNLATGGTQGGGGGVNITIQGNVIADDESQVNSLIDRIKDQLEFRNATLAV